MLTRPSAEDLVSFFYYFIFSLFHFSICVLYFFCPSARSKLLLLRKVKSLRCPQHQASQDGARSTGTTQALQEMSTTRELMRLSPGTARLSTKKKCSLVALFFCIFCPCLFSNKNNRSVSANFLSSQRKWELWLFLTLHSWQFLVKVLQTGRDEENAHC